MAYTEQEKDLILARLEPYFKLGLKLQGAVNAYNSENPSTPIVRRTVQQWLDDDELLKEKIEAWKAHPNVIARKNWIRHVYDPASKHNYEASKDWLERREKDDFSTRQEFTGKGGKDLVPLTEEKRSKIISMFRKTPAQVPQTEPQTP